MFGWKMVCECVCVCSQLFQLRVLHSAKYLAKKIVALNIYLCFDRLVNMADCLNLFCSLDIDEDCTDRDHHFSR